MKTLLSLVALACLSTPAFASTEESRLAACRETIREENGFEPGKDINAVCRISFQSASFNAPTCKGRYQYYFTKTCRWHDEEQTPERRCCFRD